MNKQKYALAILRIVPMFVVYFCTKWLLMLVAILVLIHGAESASTFTHIVIYTITVIPTTYWYYYFSVRQWEPLLVVKKQVEAPTNTY